MRISLPILALLASVASGFVAVPQKVSFSRFECCGWDLLSGLYVGNRLFLLYNPLIVFVLLRS